MKPSKRSRKSSWLYTLTINIIFTRLLPFSCLYLFLLLNATSVECNDLWIRADVRTRSRVNFTATLLQFRSCVPETACSHFPHSIPIVTPWADLVLITQDPSTQSVLALYHLYCFELWMWDPLLLYWSITKSILCRVIKQWFARLHPLHSPMPFTRLWHRCGMHTM